MTTWTVVDNDDAKHFVTHISTAAYAALARDQHEQRLSRVISVHTSILLGSLCGALMTIAGLVVAKLLGA